VSDATRDSDTSRPLVAIGFEKRWAGVTIEPMSDKTGPTAEQAKGLQQVEDFLAAVGEPHRTTLLKLRGILRGLLPTATEGLSYAVPAFIVDGRAIAGYAPYKNHNSYFPYSGSVLTALADDLQDYTCTSGALHFPIDKPLPVALVRKLVKARLAQSSEVFNGKRRDYYDDGVLKSEGSMRQGEPHGAWSWYRADGTLMRTGEFVNGSQVGRWRTFDRDGNLVKETMLNRAK
jgi:uncharacterized protein YdhG (YjbR/CyaY superfamily)